MKLGCGVLTIKLNSVSNLINHWFTNTPHLPPIYFSKKIVPTKTAYCALACRAYAVRHTEVFTHFLKHAKPCKTVQYSAQKKWA